MQTTMAAKIAAMFLFISVLFFMSVSSKFSFCVVCKKKCSKRDSTRSVDSYMCDLPACFGVTGISTNGVICPNCGNLICKFISTGETSFHVSSCI